MYDVTLFFHQRNYSRQQWVVKRICKKALDIEPERKAWYRNVFNEEKKTAGVDRSKTNTDEPNYQQRVRKRSEKRPLNEKPPVYRNWMELEWQWQKEEWNKECARTKTSRTKEEKCRKKEMSIIRMFSFFFGFFLLCFPFKSWHWCWSLRFLLCTHTHTHKETSVFLVIHYLCWPLFGASK